MISPKARPTPSKPTSYFVTGPVTSSDSVTGPAAENLGSSRNRQKKSTISKLKQEDGLNLEAQNDIRRLQAASQLYRSHTDDVQADDHSPGPEKMRNETCRLFSGLLEDGEESDKRDGMGILKVAWSVVEFVGEKARKESRDDGVMINPGVLLIWLTLFGLGGYALGRRSIVEAARKSW